MKVRTLFLALTALLIPTFALSAQDAGSVRDGSSAATIEAGVAPKLPPGADTTQLPSGHPHVAQPQEDDGLYRPPPDQTVEDSALGEGSIQVVLRDPTERPVTSMGITLGVLEQSVAKGENRKHLSQTSDENGTALFAGLQTGSGIAYRVTVVRDGATFAALPFQLPVGRGMKVLLHIYPVTHDIKTARIVFQGALFVDVKDDRVQVQQAFRVSNYGPVTWVPSNVVIDLPADYSAFNSSQQMSDQGFDGVLKGARLRGTFSPGDSDIGMSWQFPYSGEKDIHLEISLPPHMASIVVRAAASQQVKLKVEGFPDAVADQDEQGNRLLVTGKQAKATDPPLNRIQLSVLDLPVPGMGRWIATALAAFGVALGLVLFAQHQPKISTKRAKSERAYFLEELEELERGHAKGDIGPKTYERARREIIDGIARTLARGVGAKSKAPENPI